MSFAVLQHVFDKTQHHGNAKVLLLALAHYANDCCGLAFPSVETLARKVGVNERNTHKLLKQVSAGLNPELEILRGQGPRGTNLYRFRGVSIATPCPAGRGVAPHRTGCPWRRKRGVATDTQSIMERSERKTGPQDFSPSTAEKEPSSVVPEQRRKAWLTRGSQADRLLAEDDT
jgi:hypothetical protein